MVGGREMCVVRERVYVCVRAVTTETRGVHDKSNGQNYEAERKRQIEDGRKRNGIFSCPSPVSGQLLIEI